MNNNIVEKEHLKVYLLGGHSEFTIANLKTGVQHSYIIDKPKDSNKIYFLNVKIGGAFVYAGTLMFNNYIGTFSQGKKGKVDKDNVVIRGLLYVINNIDTLPPNVVVYHSGKCSKCGRKLDDIESIKRGLGPDCYKKVKKIVS